MHHITDNTAVDSRMAGANKQPHLNEHQLIRDLFLALVFNVQNSSFLIYNFPRRAYF